MKMAVYSLLPIVKIKKLLKQKISEKRNVINIIYTSQYSNLSILRLL